MTQHLGALLGTEVHHAAGLKAQPEVAHDLTGVDQRHGGVHNALRAGAVRRGEDLLGRDVGEERGAVLRAGGAAVPDVARIHTHDEVGSVGRLVAQGVKAVAVEEALSLLEGGVVGLPSALGIVPVGASHGEDEVPQAVDGLGVRRAGEDLTRPCGHRDAAAGLAGSMPLSAEGSEPSRKRKVAPASARELSCSTFQEGVWRNQSTSTFS